MVISVAILISGLVSLTLTPMMCSLILKSSAKSSLTSDTGHVAKIKEFFDGFRSGYRKSLDFALEKKIFVLVLTVASIGFSVKLYIDSPKGFFPQEDTGLVRLSTEGPLDISFEAMSVQQQSINEIVLSDVTIETIYFTESATAIREHCEFPKPCAYNKSFANNT
jgi:HAE1 family hydrophobic/amphiphilic exporter-1